MSERVIESKGREGRDGIQTSAKGEEIVREEETVPKLRIRSGAILLQSPSGACEMS